MFLNKCLKCNHPGSWWFMTAIFWVKGLAYKCIYSGQDSLTLHPWSVLNN